MFIDLCFMSRYAFAVVVVVLAAAELARLQAWDRPPAHHYTPGRLVTLSCMPKSFQYAH
jgi:hypothetical protein